MSWSYPRLPEQLPEDCTGWANRPQPIVGIRIFWVRPTPERVMGVTGGRESTLRLGCVLLFSPLTPFLLSDMCLFNLRINIFFTHTPPFLRVIKPPRDSEVNMGSVMLVVIQQNNRRNMWDAIRPLNTAASVMLLLWNSMAEMLCIVGILILIHSLTVVGADKCAQLRAHTMQKLNTGPMAVTAELKYDVMIQYVSISHTPA